MAQRVVVRQNIDFEAEFLAQAEKGELRIVENIRDIDPYGMLLAGLGVKTWLEKEVLGKK
ncbi:MAG: hypothetical protein M0Z48_13665 [Nitrospiraceae bacterium]|nr:hypothetical protein [Nitrospiraceae bacterium]